MPRVRALLVGCVIALATGCRARAPTATSTPAQAPAPASAARPAPASFRFGWGLPSAVAVDMIGEGDGHSIHMRQVVTLDIDADGEHLVVRFRDVDLIAVDGHDARDPALRRALAPVIALLAMPFEIVLTPDGEVADARLPNLATLVELFTGTRSEAPDPQIEAKLKAMFERPEMQSLIKEKAVEIWGLWVGAWIGLDLAPGQERVVEDTVESFGAVAPRQVRVRHEGPADPPGHVRLGLVSTVELRGPQVKQMVEAMMGERLPEKGEKSLQDLLISRVDRFDVVVDPTRLRPHRAVHEEIRSVNGEPKRSRRATYTFDWSYDQRDAAESASLVCAPGAPGEVSKEAVRAVVRNNLDLVRGCYEAGLRRDPALRGRVTLEFRIAPDGRVEASEIVERDVPEAVAECIRYGSQTWRFPAPRCGSVTVRYPFVLEPSAPAPAGGRR